MIFPTIKKVIIQNTVAYMYIHLEREKMRTMTLFGKKILPV